ncbi:hypothetical protein R5R35_004353 [Gryllus longicercus]|uniref:Odorant binding protein n=1 Tax=Gryllus longicercus TaxID=2509291 RepID=A0AAN9VK93_9ORTH
MTSGYHFLPEHENFIDELFYPTLYEESLDESKSRFTRAIETSDIENELQSCCSKLKNLKESCCGQFGVFQPDYVGQKVALECLAEAQNNDLKTICENQGLFLTNRLNLISHTEIVLCVKECIARKNNWIDSDGNLVEPDIEEHIKQTVISKDTLWSEGIVDKSIKKCLKEAKATVTAFESKGQKLKCNPSAQVFHRCLWRILELTCLKDQQKSSVTCDIRRTVFAQEEVQRRKLINQRFNLE